MWHVYHGWRRPWRTHTVALVVLIVVAIRWTIASYVLIAPATKGPRGAQAVVTTPEVTRKPNTANPRPRPNQRVGKLGLRGM